MEYNFLQSMYQCKLLYEIEFTNEDDFVELGLNAWEIIGNKRVRIYTYTTSVGDDLSVELPCNADIVEAVVTPPEDWNFVTNKHNGGDVNSQIAEEWIEGQKIETHPLYISGHFVHYTKVGSTLYFKEPYSRITILYKEVVKDSDGLPYINDKEMNAIATYVAYVKNFRDGLITKNQTTIQLAQLLEKKWYIQCSQARTPSEQLSQNQLNEIANAKNRMPGKRYGTSYKPVMR